MLLPKGKRCDLDTLLEIYGDEGIAAVIFDSASVAGTIPAIESQKCTLPELHEAEHFCRVRLLTGKYGDTEIAQALASNPKLENLIGSLESRLTALETGKGR